MNFKELFSKIILEQDLSGIINQKKAQFHNVLDPVLQADVPKFTAIKDNIDMYYQTILNYPLYVKIQFNDKTKIQTMEQAVYIWFTKCVQIYNSWDKTYTLAYIGSYPQGDKDSDDYYKANPIVRTFKLTMDFIYSGYPSQRYVHVEYDWQRIPIFAHRSEWQRILTAINSLPKDQALDLIKQELEAEKDEIVICHLQSNAKKKKQEQRIEKAKAREEFMITHSIPKDVYLNLIDSKFGTQAKYMYIGSSLNEVYWQPLKEFYKACGLNTALLPNVTSKPIEQALDTGFVVYVEGCTEQKNPDWPPGYVLISELYYALRRSPGKYESPIKDNMKIFVLDENASSPVTIKIGEMRKPLCLKLRMLSQEKEKSQNEIK